MEVTATIVWLPSTVGRARPFTVASGLPKLRAHWCRPRVVVQLAFLEWTNHGKLRHSRLLGLRDDIAPQDVRKGTR